VRQRLEVSLADIQESGDSVHTMKLRFGLASLFAFTTLVALYLPGLIVRLDYPRQIASQTTSGNGAICSITIGRRIHRWNSACRIDFVVIERNTGDGALSLSSRCRVYGSSSDYHPVAILELDDRTLTLSDGQEIVEIENGVVTQEVLQVDPGTLDEYLAAHSLDATIEGLKRFIAGHE